MAVAATPLDPFIARRGACVLDGGLATELERRGADLRDPLWSAKLLLDDPDLIRAVHLDYLRAGADVITTASYQATLPALMRRGLDAEQARAVLLRSVRLACAAREQFLREQCDAERPRPLVAASIGCYGAALHDGSEYRGDYGLSVPDLIDWHRPRLRLLADSGADLLACETIPCLAEAAALARLLGEVSHRPAWVSFSCRDESSLRHGEPLVEAVALVSAAPNVSAVGVNCTAPRHVEPLLHAARSATDRALVAYPNSGEGWDAERHAWTETPESFDWGGAARRWRAAGARLIGGCCRTTPEIIREIAAALRD